MRKGRYSRRKIWVLKRSVSAKISILVRTVCVICWGKVGGSISGLVVVSFEISGSVSDVGGAGIGIV